MDYYEELDVLSFFKLVHMAYGDAIRDNNGKSMIFYHIHNPDTHSQLNFLNLGNSLLKSLVSIVHPGVSSLG